MHFSTTGLVLLVAGTAMHINAHTTFTNFFVDGVDQGDGTAVRMSNNNQQATFPLPNVTTPNMACGVNGETGVARVASANAGSMLTFEWRSWPDGEQPGSIDSSHKGPCAVYMKKVANSAASNNAAGDGWFKIMEDGYDSTTDQWCTEKLIPNDGHIAAIIPKDLAAGYYLVRPELLALHQADKTPPDPQFYVGCAQIFLSSSGTASPPDTVSIPGYVTMDTPAMTFNIWQVPMKLPFPDFGPPVYTASNAKRNVQARDLTQTIGLKPEGCLLTNVNWCGFAPPQYTDQNSCYASSQNCSAQTTVCYNSAGPTGSKNCHNWENYCTEIRNDCTSGPYSGPPSFSNFMPVPLEKLDVTKVVMAAGSSMQEGSSSTAVDPSSAPSVAMSPTPTTAAAPASGTATPIAETDQSMPNGSIDTCGTNGGQNCKTGMCCSAHGYCGTADEYCGASCQSEFGKCAAAGSASEEKKKMRKRGHKGHHGHVLRRKGLHL